ncbi:MAG: hypothetical protein H6Q67_1698, partial [Firmicutes bacterium]|nr:hypothetical protein [Bacillota bacterium]
MAGKIKPGGVLMKGKRFDAQFKKDIVKLYLNGERTCPSLAAE